MNEAPMTEKQLSQTIVHAARDCGWLVARTWLSKFSPAGEPDLRMVHVDQKRIIYAELKSAKGKVSEAQQEWLDALRATGLVEVYVWKPEDLEDAYRLLVTGPTHAA